MDGFRAEAQNIWLEPNVFTSGPFAKGHYHLSVCDSIIEKALRTGIALGNEGSEFKFAPDEGDYEVRLRNNLTYCNHGHVSSKGYTPCCIMTITQARKKIT